VEDAIVPTTPGRRQAPDAAITLAPADHEIVDTGGASPIVSGEPIQRTRADFAQRIRARIVASVEAVLDVGTMLIDAKQTLAHGDFEKMVREDLEWSPQTARKFMAIASHPVLSNRAHVRDLPESWGTLSELARVQPHQLEEAIVRGDVRPGMRRRDAVHLVRPVEAADAPSGSPTAKPKPKRPSQRRSTKTKSDLMTPEAKDRVSALAKFAVKASIGRRDNMQAALREIANALRAFTVGRMPTPGTHERAIMPTVERDQDRKA